MDDSPSTLLLPGTPAPDFTLASSPTRNISLSQFKGRPVILSFYPADWSPVCGDQMVLYNEVHSEFKAFDAVLLGISVDSPWCHQAYTKDRKLEFLLLSDGHPKGAVARRYGVFREADGICERALFVIDAEGIIRWSYLSPIGVNPGADGILRALESIATRQEVAQKV